jgi:hypothetical protein
MAGGQSAPRGGVEYVSERFCTETAEQSSGQEYKSAVSEE